MHYPWDAFTKSQNVPTILPRWPTGKPAIGQRQGLTDLDIRKIRRYYGCETLEESKMGEDWVLIKNSGKSRVLWKIGIKLKESANFEKFFWFSRKESRKESCQRIWSLLPHCVYFGKLWFVAENDSYFLFKNLDEERFFSLMYRIRRKRQLVSVLFIIGSLI